MRLQLSLHPFVEFSSNDSEHFQKTIYQSTPKVIFLSNLHRVQFFSFENYKLTHTKCSSSDDMISILVLEFRLIGEYSFLFQVLEN